MPELNLALRFTHVIDFSAAHHVRGADPATTAAHTHGHRYHLEVVSGQDSEFRLMEQWVQTYLADRDLSSGLDMPSTHENLALYLAKVMHALDSQLMTLQIIVDGAHGVVVSVQR